MGMGRRRRDAAGPDRRQTVTRRAGPAPRRVAVATNTARAGDAPSRSRPGSASGWAWAWYIVQRSRPESDPEAGGTRPRCSAARRREETTRATARPGPAPSAARDPGRGGRLRALKERQDLRVRPARQLDAVTRGSLMAPERSGRRLRMRDPMRQRGDRRPRDETAGHQVPSKSKTTASTADGLRRAAEWCRGARRCSGGLSGRSIAGADAHVSGAPRSRNICHRIGSPRPHRGGTAG